MPTRKTSKKPGSPIRPIYGIAIHDCMKRGNAAEMKKLAARARKHVKDVKAALAALEKKIASTQQ
ncbi:MAG TPA: DUF1843 domain-containing protein [Pyrinomonadaceae bacterium]|nr:DUF1843 domain-containing protein [Pyrinomonadaceae bacterium]